jgi:hypothetical protein
MMLSKREIEDRFILLQSLCNIPEPYLDARYSDLDSEVQDMYKELKAARERKEKS